MIFLHHEVLMLFLILWLAIILKKVIKVQKYGVLAYVSFPSGCFNQLKF